MSALESLAAESADLHKSCDFVTPGGERGKPRQQATHVKVRVWKARRATLLCGSDGL